MTTAKEIFENKGKHWGENQDMSLLSAEDYLAQKYILSKKSLILEAGCGGGRIAFQLKRIGYERIDAFDFCEEFIEKAVSENLKRHENIRFFVADASDLSMLADESYDNALYLQQILSFVPNGLLDKALEESYRVLKPGGITLFSLLNYDGRRLNRALSFILDKLRKMREEDLNKQELPWLKYEGEWNWMFLRKGQAVNYWITKSEAKERLMKAGYQVLEVYSSLDFGENQNSILYFVCQK